MCEIIGAIMRLLSSSKAVGTYCPCNKCQQAVSLLTANVLTRKGAIVEKILTCFILLLSFFFGFKDFFFLVVVVIRGFFLLLFLWVFFFSFYYLFFLVYKK